MGKRTGYDPGTFSWADLGTTDVAGAKAFYGEVFGWQPRDEPMGDGGFYTMCTLDGDNVAAIYSQRDDQRAAGVPPSWLSYITVARVDELVPRVDELGGAVLGEPFDVLDAGRMAIVRDPAGAVVALWEARASIGAQRVNDVGCLSWNDLVTTDPQSAERFYGGLFDWTFEEPPSSQGYRIIWLRGRTNGGVMPAELVGNPPSHWLPYFNAGALDDTVVRIERGGGRLVAGPRSVPAGRFAVAQDPQGAHFALFEGPVDD